MADVSEQAARPGHDRDAGGGKLTKAYKGRRVVNGVSFACAPARRSASRPNGAGKTCFYMVTGLVPVDQGTIDRWP